MHVNNGDLGKDAITGFRGMVVATADYLVGGKQVCLQPMGVDEKGKPKKSLWFDIDRVECCGDGVRLPGGAVDNSHTSR